MRHYSTGELLFRLVCLVVLSSVESFNWTAQPTNPTPAIKGQDVSLAWNYSLTADELLQSQTQFAIKFSKQVNQSSSNYDQIGTKGYVPFLGEIAYAEPQAPRIVIDRNDQATLHIKDVRREDEGTYKIEFSLQSAQTVGEQRVNLTVLEHPELDYASDNQDVCEDSMVTLFCNATGRPTPNINWTRVWENGTDGEQLPVVDGSYVMSNIKRSSNGTYRCTAYNGVGDPVNRTVKVIVRYSASVVRVVKSSNTVIEGNTFSLTCEVSGDPMPNVTWITMSDDEYSDGNILNFTKIMRGDSGDYRCETGNRCGKESRNESINVFYPPTVTREGHIIDVSEGHPVSLSCPVLGNPPPNITWHEGNDTSPGTMINTNNTLKFTETMVNDSGWYTCFAKNSVGNVTVTVQLLVVVENPSTPITSSEPMTKDPGVRDSEVNATAKIRNVRYKKELANMSTDDSRNLTSRFKRRVSEVYQKADDYKDIYSDTRVNKFENGSVVVFFTIIFNKVVHIDDAILVLKNASENGTLGDLKIEPGSIKALLPVATTPATASPKETATTTPTSDHEKDNDLWIIIGASVGGVIVLAIVVAVVAWCVHHKRKCRRKGSKVRCSESEAFAPGEDNGSGHVNNGYADAGPRPTAMEDMSQHQGASAVPTYAVVDKSAKKGSKKDKVEEQKPQAEAPEATYAEVDKSKKSKKKPKPGEVLYADLGDFQQMQELPRVSTSPQALPPIKKPTTYVETQYADITQFLKGDVTLPDSNNSQGPATGSKAAPAPENSNSQEPGTNTKETSRASNPGGDGGPGHETNF